MSDKRREELIDLLLGELEPARDAELRELVRGDPALQRELRELEALFGFMRQGEEIEVDPAVHATVMTEARRVTRPSLSVRLRALPQLFRFRFQRSVAFRVAAVSLGVHLVVMALLLQFDVLGPRPAEIPEFEVGQVDPDELPVPDYRPDPGFARRLGRARVSRTVRLRHYGVEGQHEAVRQGVETLLTTQKPDGSFGALE
ncbi:MAG: anti-sigma factor family protein, partial [Planctomycetota bacterium]